MVALWTAIAALALDAALGLGYARAEHLSWAMGLYCGLGNGVTEGPCTAPHTTPGHLIDAAEFLLVVPLFASAFSFFTSGLSAIHGLRFHQETRRLIEHAVRNRQNPSDPPPPPPAP